MTKPLRLRASPVLVAMLSLVGLVFVGVSGCGHDQDDHDHGAHDSDASAPTAGAEDPAAKPYPLEYCLVSNEELGSAGKAKRIVYEGQEIKFCCGDCEKEFRKEPAKFMKQIAEAKKK